MANSKIVGSSVATLFQKSLNQSIRNQMLGRDTTNPALTNRYQKHILKISKRIAKSAERRFKEKVVSDYVNALSDIAALLKTGLFIGSFKPLGKRYSAWKKAKRFKGAGTFWLQKGDLSKEFSTLLRGHKPAAKSSKVHVKFTDRGSTATISRHRYTMVLVLPSTGSDFLDNIIQVSFSSGTEQSSVGFGLRGALRRIGYLEGTPTKGSGKRHRPFIASLMASRGKTLDSTLGKVIKNQGIS